MADQGDQDLAREASGVGRLAYADSAVATGGAEDPPRTRFRRHRSGSPAFLAMWFESSYTVRLAFVGIPGALAVTIGGFCTYLAAGQPARATAGGLTGLALLALTVTYVWLEHKHAAAARQAHLDGSKKKAEENVARRQAFRTALQDRDGRKD